MLSFLIGGSNSRQMGGTRGPFVWPMWAQAHLSGFSFWIIYCCTFPDEVTLLREVTSYLGGTHVKLNESEMPLLTLGPCRVTNDGTIGRCVVVTGNPSVSINPDKCFYTCKQPPHLLCFPHLSGHLDRKHEGATGSCHKHSTFIASGSTTQDGVVWLHSPV